MSTASKLVNVIDELEKQSNNLISVMEMYNKIEGLNNEINKTSKKYESVLKDIETIKMDLLKNTDNINSTLELSSKNIEKSLENSKDYIDMLKESMVSTNYKIDEIYKLHQKIDKELKNSEIAIDNNLKETYSRISDELEVLKKNVKMNLENLDLTLSNILLKIENNNDKITEMKIWIENNSKRQGEEINRNLSSQINNLRSDVSNKINTVEENINKNNKLQLGLFAVTIILLIANLIVK